MKTSGREREDKAKDKDKDKDGKHLDLAKGSDAVGPGFGMAKISQRKDGTWLVEVKCVNGDAGRNLTNVLPKGITLFGEKEAIQNPSEVAVFLPDGWNIDTQSIFPWGSGAGNPLRLGGGIIKGTLTEGAQRATGGVKTPLEVVAFTTDWINGANARVSMFVLNKFGNTFYEGDVVFGMVVVDPVTGGLTMTAIAKSEGGCLNLVS